MGDLHTIPGEVVHLVRGHSHCPIVEGRTRTLAAAGRTGGMEMVAYVAAAAEAEGTRRGAALRDFAVYVTKPVVVVEEMKKMGAKVWKVGMGRIRVEGLLLEGGCTAAAVAVVIVDSSAVAVAHNRGMA